MSNIALTILLITLLFVVVNACPGLFGGGGGGGCGCMMGHPMMGGCGGGCGRKKREVLEQQVKTQENSPCPQSEWKRVMEMTITDEPASSVYAIQGALHKQYEAKFFVTCSKIKDQTGQHPAVFVTNGEGYCSYGNDKVWCEAIALFG